MRSLSKAAEQKLIGAIEQAAAYVNGGMEPNEAIVKSAAAADIPAGHINLMVHAYNTGRTNKQREQGENTYEKAADFRLADAAVVLERLYPAQVKTSAELVREQTVSTEYAVSPAGFLARRKAALEKAAAAQVALPEKTYTPTPKDPEGELRRAYSMKVSAQRQAEELRRQATAAYTKAAARMDDLATYFRTPGNMSFQDAVEQVGLRLGQEGVSVLQKVAGAYPQLEKQAATKHEHFGHNHVYDLVGDVLASVGEYVAAQNKVPPEKKAEAAGKQEVPAVLTGSILHNPAEEPLVLKEAAAGGSKPKPETGSSLGRRIGRGIGYVGHAIGYGMYGAKGPKGESDGFLDSAAKPVNTIGETIGVNGATSSGDIAKSVMGFDADPEKMRLQEYKNISAPDHEISLKNIRAQATLHDLLLNDPVISGYDSREVALAFNDVANAAPNVVESPSVLQAVLRKRLEAGQLADFDVKQLLEMDKLKEERDLMALNRQKLEHDLI